MTEGLLGGLPRAYIKNATNKLVPNMSHGKEKMSERWQNLYLTEEYLGHNKHSSPLGQSLLHPFENKYPSVFVKGLMSETISSRVFRLR